MQVRRTQALTVLLALVRADAGSATLETLQTSGLLGSLLQDLTSNARADLLKVRADSLPHANVRPPTYHRDLQVHGSEWADLTAQRE